MAAAATIVIVVAALLMLIYSSLHCEWPPQGNAAIEPQLQQDTIMFGGEYVMLGDTPNPTEANSAEAEAPAAEADTHAEEPSTPGEDLSDAGKPAEKPADPVTQKQESPMKVKVKVKTKQDKAEKTGPSTAANPDKKIEKERKAEASAVASRTKNAFGKSGGTGSGKQGSPNGNASHGALNGTPGIGGLDGYTLASWGRPHSQWEGTVVVRVRVNARGQVIEARAISGSGNAWAHPEVRRNCEKESLVSRFSVKKSRTTEGMGTITWRFV